jgi:hypothetical protein
MMFDLHHLEPSLFAQPAASEALMFAWDGKSATMVGCWWTKLSR